MQTKDETYLDLKSLSGRCHLSVRTLWTYLKEPGGFPYYKMNGKILVFWPEFKQWMQTHRVKSMDIDRIVNSVLE